MNGMRKKRGTHKKKTNKKETKEEKKGEGSQE